MTTSKMGESPGNDSPMFKLLHCMPQAGVVYWIGVRPARLLPLVALAQVEAVKDFGLTGDHYTGKPGSKRQVTLILKEHLETVGKIMKLQELSPEMLRRNIVVSGINLLALKGKAFNIGNVLLEYTGECHPCSRMEENLGAGGYNAMRGHGGITAKILTSGIITIGDEVKMA